MQVMVTMDDESISLDCAPAPGLLTLRGASWVPGVSVLQVHPDDQAEALRRGAGWRREGFLHARRLLRDAVGELVHCAPGQVTLSRESWGGLSVATFPELTVSISYRPGAAAVAVACSVAVGVDLEAVAFGEDHALAAAVAFGRDEREALRLALPGTRPALALRYWVRREAVVKGMRSSLAACEGETLLAGAALDLRVDSWVPSRPGKKICVTDLSISVPGWNAALALCGQWE